jgi:hypothetical protein
MEGINLADITRLHRELVVRWHDRDVDNPCDGLLGIVCRQMSYNFLLWHEEDVARSRDVSDARIAQVKRAIDGYNQQRNDWIEKLDDWITERLVSLNITTAAGAPQNTETLGSTIDRLSILALRIYHLEEQRDRADATAEHRESVSRKLAVAFLQLEDLSRAAQQLADDLFAGRKRHKTYRALKMYNDPTLNPYLYQARKAVA